MGWLGALLGPWIDAVLGWAERLVLDVRRSDQARDDGAGRARAEAALETQDVIGEIADAQSHEAASPDVDGAAVLAAELRARAARLAGGGTGRGGL